MSFNQLISARKARASRTAPISWTWVIYLLIAILATTLNVQAASPVETQLANIPVGTAVKVRMADGRTIKGKLVASTEGGFELLQREAVAPLGLKYTEVKSIKPLHRRAPSAGTTLLLGGFLATMGVLIAFAGWVV